MNEGGLLCKKALSNHSIKAVGLEPSDALVKMISDSIWKVLSEKNGPAYSRATGSLLMSATLKIFASRLMSERAHKNCLKNIKEENMAKEKGRECRLKHDAYSESNSKWADYANYIQSFYLQIFQVHMQLYKLIHLIIET